MDTGDILRAFCISDREVCRLNEERKKSVQDLQINKQSVRKIISDTLVASGQSCMTCNLDGQLYVVKLQELKPSVSFLATDCEMALLTAWKDRSDDFRARLLGSEDIVDAAVSFILELGPKPEALQQTRRSLQVRRTKIERLSGDISSAKPEVEDLVRVFIESGQKAASLSKEYRELKLNAAQQRDAGEQLLIQQLEQLPSGTVPKVSITDSRGGVESFYLRLKPPRQQAPRKILASAFAKLLRQQLKRELARANLQKRAAVEMIMDEGFGEQLRKDLLDALATRSSNHVESGKRVSVDKVRTAKKRSE